MRAGPYIIEVRWGSAVGDEFSEIQTICGTLTDAKNIVLTYMHKHHLTSLSEWVEGEPDQNGRVYFARDHHVMFRIRS